MLTNLSNPDVIVYGGAFDPPHQGHIDCVRAVLDKFPSCEVLIMPGYQPAGAEGVHKSPSASYSDRIELCESAFVRLDSQRVRVSRLESQIEGTNYTWKTLAKLGASSKDRRIATLIGLDQFKVFGHWVEPLKILEMSDLIVARRDSRESIVKIADAVADSLSLDLEWDESLGASSLGVEGSQLFLLDIETSKASSSEIRFRLNNREQVPSGWIPEEVQNIIYQRRLYRESSL